MSNQREILQHLVRTVLAFCRLAEHVDDDAREDLIDASASLLDIWTSLESSARADAIRQWCQDAAVALNRLNASDHAFLRAQSRLLRLRAAVGQPIVSAAEPKKAAPRQVARSAIRDLGSNARVILQWLQQNPGARTRELVTNFSGKLSDRTVMRSLKELVTVGLIRRTQKEGAAIYEAIGEEPSA